MKRNRKWLPVLGIILGLALALSAVPALAADNGVTVSVNAPPEVPEGGTFTTYIDVDYVELLDTGQFDLSFDNTAIQVTDVVTGVRKGDLLPEATVVMASQPTTDTVRVIFDCPGAGPGAGVTGSGTLIEIDFNVTGTACQTSGLNFQGTLELNDNWAQTIPATWVDGSVHVEGPFEERVVVSGTMPAVGNDGRGDPRDPQPPYPPGFEPRDEFVPCEWVWVWGYGFEFCQWYEIYIQPYEEGVMVAEGQPLDHMLSAPLGYPPPGGEPVIVHIGEDGTFEGGPVKLFHATEEHICMYWEIVADKIPGPLDNKDIATLPGIYNSDEDGLDAVALNAWGFHIVPEAVTIVLLGVGLAGLGGYVVLRRREGTDSDA